MLLNILAKFRYEIITGQLLVNDVYQRVVFLGVFILSSQGKLHHWVIFQYIFASLIQAFIVFDPQIFVVYDGCINFWPYLNALSDCGPTELNCFRSRDWTLHTFVKQNH